MKQISPKDLIRNKPPWRVNLLRLTLVSFVFGGMGNSRSESVYRCGSSYSSSAQCAQESATEVTAHTEPRHHPSTPNVMPTHEQREADALEKKRWQSERQTTQNQPVRVIVAPVQNQTAPSPETPRHGQRLHKPQSPYFTAKDPNKPAKKTAKD